jgi:hypothetical protein
MIWLGRLLMGMVLLAGVAGCASTQPPPTIDITGKWQGTWFSTNQPAGGSGQIEMTVMQTGPRFTGNLLVTGSGTDPSGLLEGFVTGNQVEITVPAGATGRLTLNGDELTGKLAGISGWTVTMRRQK